MGYARGLVRYATQRAIDTGLDARGMLRRVLRPRVIVYGAILVMLISGLLGSLATRNPLRVDLIRDRHALARVVEDGDIQNTYRIPVSYTHMTLPTILPVSTPCHPLPLTKHQTKQYVYNY